MLVDSFLDKVLGNREENNPCYEKNKLAVLSIKDFLPFACILPEHPKVYKRDKEPDCPQERVCFGPVDFPQFPGRMVEPINPVNPKGNETCKDYKYRPSFLYCYLITLFRFGKKELKPSGLSPAQYPDDGKLEHRKPSGNPLSICF